MDDKAGPPSGGAVADGVQVYRLKGPAWRPRLHPGSRAIGVPDLGPHKIKQAEDEISELTVKNGFSVLQVVGNETFSAHDMICDRLRPLSLLSQLGSLFHEVSLRRDDLTNHRSTAAPLQSRPPQRVTLNEVKLAAYIKELADPQVPLKKLARSVPHGYRGERMLDMLWNGGNLAPAFAVIKAQALTSSKQETFTPRSVTIERAVWFIRVVGSSELSSNRTRQGTTSSYTIEWTSVFMGWLRRQIVELNIVSAGGTAVTPTTPSSPNIARQMGQARTALTPAHHDGQYSLLLEDDFRHRWVSKWHYTIQLLRSLCSENLVDTQTALKCTLDMLRTSNLAQITFLVALVEELIISAYSNAALVHHALDVLCAKLDMYAPSVEEGRFTASIKRELKAMIEHIAVMCPESLVNPARWARYRAILTPVVEASFLKDVGQALVRRNEVLNNLLLKPEHSGAPSFPSSSPDSKRRMIALLDNLTVISSLRATFVQLSRPCNISESEKLKIILVWSTTTSRKGKYRPFAGAQLLYLFSHGKAPGSSANGKAAPAAHKMDMGTFLFRWISEVESALQVGKEGQMTNVAAYSSISQSIDVSLLTVLVGELMRLGVFSYSKYIQRLTARGMTASQVREEKTASPGHLHAKIMRSVPLLHTSASLQHQRRVAIYGNRSKESWEEAMQRRAAKEMVLAFPWRQSDQATHRTLKWDTSEPLRHFWTSSLFVQHRVIQAQIMPYFRESTNFDTLSASCLSHLAHFLIAANDFVSLCEIILCLRDRDGQVRGEIVRTVRSLILGHRHIWIAMDVPLLERIGLDTFPSYDTRPEPSRRSPVTDPDARTVLQQSMKHYLDGKEEQAGALIAGEEAQKLHWLEGLPITILTAVGDVFLKGTIHVQSEGKIIGWLKLVTSSAGLDWDDKWQVELVTCLLSYDVESEEQARALAAVVLALVLSNASLGVDVLRGYVIPRLTHAVAARETSATPSIQCLLAMIRILFERQSDENDLLAAIRIAGAQSVMIVSSTIRDVHTAIRLLALLAETAADTQVDETIRIVCTNPTVQFHTQPILFNLCSFLQEKVRESILGTIIGHILSPTPTLLLNNALDADYREWFEAADDWHTQQMQTELCLAIQLLEVAESGQQNRAQSKIQSIARLAAQKWFTADIIHEVGLPLLLESRSILFAATIGEELLKRVHEHALSAVKGSMSPLIESIQCAKLYAQSKAKTALPSSSVAPVLLSAVQEQLDGEKDCWQEGDKSAAANSNEQLASLLSILCLLLQFDNIWSMAQSRTVAPLLIFALFRQAVQLSCQGEASQAMTTQILDVAAYTLQQIPSEIVFMVQGSGDTIIEMIRDAMPDDGVASRIFFLLNCTEKSPSSLAYSMMLAPNSASIFTSGRFVADKPWEYHNNVEALEYYLRDPSQSVEEGGERQDEIDSALLPLVNNGSISLEFFSAKKTRDRIAPSTIEIDSEMSYGLGEGGEPMYARDVRRSLLGLETDEEVKKQAKSLARLKGTMLVNEQPGGNSATPKAVADTEKSTSTSTTKKRKDADSSSLSIKESAAGDAKKKSRKR